MVDTLLIPLIFSGLQFGAGFLDSYTTTLCFHEGERTGLLIYEQNPIYSIPLGQQPSLATFMMSDLISVAAMHGIGWLIRKTPAHDYWFVPQLLLIGAQIWQSNWNYQLYQKLKRER
jgi:hypothetical protein